MKKILSLFTLVLLSCMGAWAQSHTLQLDVTQGAYYRGNSVWTNAWLTNWKSNEFTLDGDETTKVILDTNSDAINNMYNDRAANAKQENGDMYFHIRPNTGGNYRPLTISLSNTKYDIESVTFTLKSSTNGDVVVKMPNGTNYTCTTESADQTVTDYTVGDNQLVIGFEPTTNQVVISDVTVKVAKHIEAPEVTSLEKLSNDKTYTIRSNRRGWWTAKDGSNNIWQTNGLNDSNVAFNSESGKTQDAEDADQQWAILKSENDNYYLYNVGQKKFFASSDSYATRYTKAALDAEVNGGVVLSFDEGAHFTGAADSPAVRWAIGKKVGTTNQFFGVTNWAGQSWQVFQNTEDYSGGADEGMYFAIVTAEDFNATDKAAALAAIEAFENASAPVTFPAEGTYYMTIANHETGRNPYIYNDLDEATGYTLQAANLDNKTNGYIWRVTSDGNGNITEIVSGTGKGIVPYSEKFTGELTSLKYASTTNKGYYYLTSDAIKAAGDHECLNASNGGQNNGHGIRTVTTWTGAGHADNHWKFDVEDLTDKFVYDVVIAAGAPAGAYAEFNGQKALNGGFFVVGGSDFVNPTAATVAGYDAEVKVENQTITVTYTQTATAVDVEYNIYVDDTKVATITRSEFEGMAPSFEFTHPAYVTVTQDVPTTITAGVTSYDIKTTYNEALPFKLDGTKYNIKENRPNPLWIFYDGSALKTIPDQVPTYSNQDNYKWIVGGDWYNGFTLKNVAESKYVTYGSANPANSADAVLTETLGAGAYFDLVQKNGFNYFKIHGTTVDAYISNCGGPGVTKLTNWNSGNNVGDGGSQLLFDEAEEIEAPTFTFTPEEGKYYSLKVKDTDLYVNVINNSEDRKKDVILGTQPEGFRFTTTTGGYHIQNASNLYIGGYTNTWNMSSETPEVWTIQIVEDGIMLHCASGNIGYDGTAAEGTACYRDKGGVTFIVEEYVAPIGKDWTAYETLLSSLYDMYGEGVGKYSVAGMDESEVMEALTAYNVALTNKIIDSYDDNMTAMQNMKDYMTLNMPKAGQFLRMKGHSSQKYVYADAASEVNHTTGNIGAGNCLPMGDLNGNEATSIFFFDGTHMISYKSANYSGLYMYQSGLNKNLADESGLDTYEFFEGVTGGTYRLHTTKANSNLYDYHADNGRTNRWSATDNVRTCFDLEEVEALPVSVSAAGFATLYAPVALTVHANVEAYTLAFDGTYLQATAVEGTIPANTGVVLKAAAGSYDFAITTGGTATSALRGTVPTIAKVEGALVLGLDEENVGFYSLKEEVANLAGFKAYYVPTSGESNLRVVFDNETLTSIISAAKENGGQAIYDLQGRRVVSAKGLNIINGKKVIK